MLPSFYIQGFRLFEELELPRLGGVNLIVGRNNTGKSALLEALFLYGADFSPNSLDKICGLRQLSSDRKPSYFDEQLVRPLFLNHSIQNSNGFRLGVDENSADRLSVKYFRNKGGALVIDNVEGRPYIARLPSGSKKWKQVYSLAKSRIIHSRHYSGEFDSETSPVLVPANKISSDELGKLFDQVHLTDKEQSVIAALQIIDPGIRGVGFIQGDNGDRIPMIRHVTSQEPLPLSSMGDGVFRLFQIVLSMVNASENMLLIDELETGLHYSLHRDVWRLLFRVAQESQTQVFVTTHSHDCIRAFESVWGEHKELGAFIRLQHKKNKIHPVYYEHENLIDALETDVEVR